MKETLVEMDTMTQSFQIVLIHNEVILILYHTYTAIKIKVTEDDMPYLCRK